MILENDRYVSFRTKAPVTASHLLISPKAHVRCNHKHIIYTYIYHQTISYTKQYVLCVVNICIIYDRNLTSLTTIEDAEMVKEMVEFAKLSLLSIDSDPSIAQYCFHVRSLNSSILYYTMYYLVYACNPHTHIYIIGATLQLYRSLASTCYR